MRYWEKNHKTNQNKFRWGTKLYVQNRLSGAPPARRAPKPGKAPIIAVPPSIFQNRGKAAALPGTTPLLVMSFIFFHLNLKHAFWMLKVYFVQKKISKKKLVFCTSYFNICPTLDEMKQACDSVNPPLGLFCRNTSLFKWWIHTNVEMPSCQR